VSDTSLTTSIAGSTSASYTCLLVNQAPPNIKYDNSEQQHIFPLDGYGVGALPSMQISWDDESGGLFTGCPAALAVPPTNPDNWWTDCSATPIRLEIVADGALSASKVFFLYPSANGPSATLSFGASPNGSVAYGDCDTTYTPHACRVTINLGGSRYFVRIKSLYNASAFDVTVPNGGIPVRLVGAQALIDSTGRATDVVRRIQVRSSINSFTEDVPDYVLHGTDRICKKFSIFGGSNVSDNGSCWAGPNPD
jgi:hypothetical protein